MTYNVFSGTLNPTHFTSLHSLPWGRPIVTGRVSGLTDTGLWLDPRLQPASTPWI